MGKYHSQIYFIKIILLSLFFSPRAYSSIYSDGVAVPTLSAQKALVAPMGVRVEGMAEANTGRADDLSAMRYNPAGLSLMGYWEWGLSSHSLLNNVQANSLALTAPLPYGNLGLYGQWLTVRDNLDVSQGVMVHPDRHKYSYHTGLSYAAPIVNRHFHVGGTVKFFAADFRSGYDSLDPYPRTQRGVFFDLGGLAHYDLSDLKGLFFYLPKVSVGLAIRNLHPRFGTMADEIKSQYPLEINTGFSLYYSHRFMLNWDFVNSPEVPTLFRSGVEIWPIYFLALRGGVVSQASGGSYRGVHWGLGIGESVGPSKFSLEYAGRSVYELGANRAPNTYHSFAIHQSFEDVLEYTDRYGKKRRIPLAITDRYVSQYRFAREILPEEVIDEAIQKTADDRAVAPSPGEEQVPPETPREKTEQRRRAVAIFPVVEDFVSSKPFPNEFGSELRKAILEFISTQPTLSPMAPLRYKLTPRREKGESEVAYMNRLCQFHSLELVVFPFLVIDDRNTDLRVRLIYYRAGDKEISAITERNNDYDRFALLQREVVRDFALNAGALLNLSLGMPQ